MRLEVGQTVGDYEVIGLLGAGGMGTVYKVRNVISDRVDAMKILLPDLLSSPDLADRFLKEIKVLASLSHPNIAALHTALRVDNQLLMIMEFVEAENLDERLGRGPIALSDSIAYIYQVLSALDYAHQRGVVHRDIKPANIAVNSAGVVKLLDFGIARAGSLRLTRTGMVVGSVYYMSPEQVNGQSADARSDLYSVGVTFYRMITGRRPIEGGSEYEVMRAQVTEMPVPPKQHNPEVPQGLSNLIMCSLMKDPAERFQTASEFRAALEPYLPDRFTPAKAPTRLERITPQSARPINREGAGSRELAGTPSNPPTTKFDPIALASLQKNLAQVIGPIAGALIKRYSQAATSLPQLCQMLADQITDDAHRQTFLRASKKELGTDALGVLAAAITQVSPLPPSSSPIVWDTALLERSRKDLAAYVGPIAKYIVDRAAKGARSLEELYALISAEIPSKKDREKFLASR